MTKSLLIATYSFLAISVAVSADRIEPAMKVAPGFAVDLVYAVPREQGSWISLSADHSGVMYASDQYGSIYRIAWSHNEPQVRPLKLPIGGVHGMTWLGDELYAVVGQRDICQTGLYRLRDTNGDSELDSVQLLKPLAGDGEHGPHALAVSPDEKSIYVIAGNRSPLPELARSRVPQNWRDDSLLPPLPALIGSETRGLPHGGWICRTDGEGKEWELICMGLRNAYAVACDRSGELFTFDSDTEFEIGLPWYRPTRVLHCVSGGDFGWRRGALKVPSGAPDLLPPLAELGLGSPTAVLLGRGAAFPVRYQDALFVADWTFGRLLAVHVTTSGAGFSAETEELVSGTPLPITAACLNPRDGALYFVTGGRKTQSALYRLTWKGPAPTEFEQRSPEVTGALQQRRQLESLHGRTLSRDELDAVWPLLASDDALLRHGARIALEHQPTGFWQDKALAQAPAHGTLTALLALARAGDAKVQPRVLDALYARQWSELGDLKSEWLRTLWLAFARSAGAPEELRRRWLEKLSPLFPAGDRTLDPTLCELLVYLGDSAIAAKTIAQLESGSTREQQIHYARCLSALKTGWTPELRERYFAWLAAAKQWRGGASFGPFIQRIAADALANVPEHERSVIQKRLAATAPTASAGQLGVFLGRSLVREWKLDELVTLVGHGTKGHADQGRRLFVAGCAACHTFAGEGGAVGSDLTAVARRMTTRDLLEAIVDPSKEISDQYATVVVRHTDGSQLTGRVINFNGGALHISENLFEPATVTKIPEGEIESITRSKISLMPAGLLNVLRSDEIIDLLTYLQSGASQNQAETTTKDETKRTHVSLERGQWRINSKVTNPASAAEGLLMNVRMVNAAFEDANAQTRPAGFDAEANTRHFIEKIPEYQVSGVNAFTICLQGGMPGYEGAINSVFEADGSLKPEYLRRVARVIEACNQHGIAVILGCYYQRQSKILRDEAALRAGVINVCRWVQSRGYKNVLLEIANEYPHPGFAHSIIRDPKGQASLLRLAKETAPELLVTASGLGNGVIHPEVAEACDFLTPHWNGTKDQDIAARLAALKRFGKPIVVNEDDKTGEQAVAALEATVANGAGYGLMLQKHNQHYPFHFDGPADDPLFYAALKKLTTPRMQRPDGNRRSKNDYFPPPDSRGGWRKPVSAAEARDVAGIDIGKLEEALAIAKASTKNGGLLVVRNGWLVYEQYFGLAHREARPNLASCGKSFTSIAVGILMAERLDLFPERLDQRVFSRTYLPPEAFPLSDPAKADVKLGQLLAFTAGIRGNNPCFVRGQEVTIDPAGPDGSSAMIDAVAVGHRDIISGGKQTSAKTLWCKPGEGYSYATSSAHLASMIVRHISGMELEAYVRQKLAEPMEWGPFTYGYRSAKAVTHTPGGGGIAMRATDMARFGYLLLREGRWDSKQLVPADYVRHCGRASPYNPHAPYSLQFDVNTDGHIAEFPRDAFWKSGSGGHMLYVVPSLDLVVWKLAGRDGQYDERDTGVPQSSAAIAAAADRRDWQATLGEREGQRLVLQKMIEAIVDRNVRQSAGK